jgi:hypothetical protein
MTGPAKQLPSAKTILSDSDDARSNRALKEVEDQWINDFIKRLNYTIDDIGRKAGSKAAKPRDFSH